ncbi:MAG: hypothetical protein FIA92_14970, partial [Chloroflexi bacterium]|nr:hypothetical protein [Chloroflexota bacterium]
TITADKLAGANVLFHGLFLGEGAPPPPSAPGAPTLVSANPADGQVALSWIAPSSDGGSSITSYTATATPEGATCVTTGATACTITGLANGTAYSFSVVAANAAGLGPASNALEATPRTVPGAPQGIVASPGNTVVGLSWEAPSSDGGAPVTGYKVYRGTSPGTGTLRATLGTVLSYSDTSLTNGTTYYYTIRALNPAGEGPSSAETPAKPFGPPGAPRSPVAVGRPGSVAIGWTAPLSDGGASVSGYRIQRGEAPGAGTEIATVGNVLSYTDATAVDGTTYYYTVSAVNAGGEGARSIAVAGTPPEIPGVEGDWLGRYGSAGYAMFAWTSSADLVLLPTATLTIERGARSAGGVTAETRALRSPDGSSRRIGAIYDKTRVRFRLDFTSAYSGFLHIYAVDWATIDRRERITVMNGASGQATELLTAFPQGAWLHYPITVAAGGRVTITADKLAGANVLLNGVFLGDGAAPPQTAPSAPRNLAAAAASPKGVNLTWTAPITNSGSLIIGYQIYRSTASGAGVLLTTVGDVLTYRDAATQKNVRYYYKVVAVNAIGASAFSNEATAVAR